MISEIIAKKLDQIGELLKELDQLLAYPLPDFKKDFVKVRAAERNFQLVVELASDINTQLLVEKGGKTPDSYKQSFTDLEKLNVLKSELARQLTASAQLRNILVHEYDFEEDYDKFYYSAKDFIPLYREYLKAVWGYIKESKDGFDN